MKYSMSPLAFDPDFDFDPASGHLSAVAADQVSDYIRRESLDVEWILDTHIHADHLSAMALLQARHGERTVIGAGVPAVQEIFGRRFNAGPEFGRDGSQFDVLVAEGDCLALGELKIDVMETPGHTPACVTYVVGSAAFVGDTLFMPDYGTARTDFPGGDAATLYDSIQRILALAPDTVLYLCHDYGTAQRSEFRNTATVAEQRANNVQISVGMSRERFVRDGEGRDAKLATPRLLLPSVQFNMRGGNPPPAEANSQH